MIGILGHKLGITQTFTDDGKLIPITLCNCGPCFVTKINTNKNNNYSVQLGYKEQIKKTKTFLKKPLLGYFDKINLPYFKYLKEIKTSIIKEIGQKITTHDFNIGEKIKITGLSIGKGFSGNIKRNNFHRGPMSHGSKHHRLPGSIGAGTTPGRVLPGKKMAGHLGSIYTTILNLEIINIIDNILIIKGSIPGKVGTLICIQSMKL